MSATVPILQPRRRDWVGTTFPSTTTIIDLTAPDRTIDLRFNAPFVDGYYRTEREVADLETRIIGMVPRDLIGESKLAFVTIGGLSPLVDFTRTKEMLLGWADLPTYMYGYEHAGTLHCLIEFDREDGDRIVQAGRAVYGRLLSSEKSCGSQVIDSLEGRVTAREFTEFYNLENLLDCWDVTTMYKVTRIARSKRYPTGFTLLGYYASMRQAFRFDVPFIIQYMNRASIKTLEQLGLAPQAVMNRELVAPLVDDQEYNKEFEAFVLSMGDLGDVMFNPNHVLSPFVEESRNVYIPHVDVRTA